MLWNRPRTVYPSRLVLSIWLGGLNALGLPTLTTALLSSPTRAQSQLTIQIAQADRQAQGQQLMQRANQQLKLGTAESIQGAIADFKTALTLWQELDNQPQQIQALVGLGTLHYLQSQHDMALKFFSQGLQITRATGNRANEIYLLYSVGNAYFSLDQAEIALEHYQQALQLLPTVDNRSLQAKVLWTMGNAYTKLGQTQTAIKTYQQSLKIYQEEGDRGGQVDVLEALALLYNQTGQEPAALQVLEQALALQRQGDNQGKQLDTLVNLGITYLSQGKSTAAISAFEQAQTLLASEPPGPFQQLLQASVSHGLAGAYVLSGERELALANYNRALTAARARGNQEFVGTILSDMGIFYDQQGQPQTALNFFKQALNIYEDLSLVSLQISSLTRIADTTLTLGEHQQALELYDDALARAQTIQKPIDEARILSAIATAYRTLGNDDLGIETYQQALRACLKSF